MNTRYVAVSLLNFFTGVVEGFLGLRFLLKLFGANPDAGFVSWVYEMSGVLLEPFRGIFPTKVFENQYVLEFSTLFAMMVYALFALLLMAVISAVTVPVDDRDVVVTKKRRR